MSAPDVPWRERAACAGAARWVSPPEDAAEAEWSTHYAMQVIQAYCDRCPVVAECAAEARDMYHKASRAEARPEGVWGGELWRAGRPIPRDTVFKRGAEYLRFHRHWVAKTQRCGECDAPMHPRRVKPKSPEQVPYGGNGLCYRCYARVWKQCRRSRTGMFAPGISWKAEELLREWRKLHSEGVRWQDAAGRLGMNRKAFERALYRARVRGDERGCRSAEEMAAFRRQQAQAS